MSATATEERFQVVLTLGNKPNQVNALIGLDYSVLCDCNFILPVNVSQGNTFFRASFLNMHNFNNFNIIVIIIINFV